MGKNVLITGGSRGIGAALAAHLAASGMNLVLTYNSNEEAAQKVAENLQKSHGVKAHYLRSNVSVFEDCKQTADEAISLLGNIDVLINNAGITADKNLMTMKPEEWNQVIDTNLTGCFNLTRALIVSMLRQRCGRIINISSVSGLMGMAGQTNYSASKAGIIGFTRSLAKEIAPRGITVNAVAPGFIETHMTEKLSQKYREQVTSQIPLKRFGKVEEVTGLVHFLTTEAAGYITGQTFVIDGGLSI